MSKQFSLALAFTFVLLSAMLLLLNQTVAVSSSGLTSKAFSPPAAPLPGSGLCEPNPPSDDGISSANQITVGVSIQCETEISPTGDIDYYIFDTAVGQNYQAEVTRLDAGDVRIRLYDNTGAVITDKTDATGGSVDGADFTWTAGYTTYYVSVEGKYGGSDEGRYSLRIIGVATPPTVTPTSTPIPWDTCEVNDDINGAWPGGPCQLSVGVEKSDMNFKPYNGQATPNNDYFTFLAKAGNTYRISTDVHDSGADTIITLYDDGGNWVAEDDDSGSANGSSIQIDLDDGWYKILVRDVLGIEDPDGSYEPDPDHIYDILVENVTAADTPTLTPTPTSASATAAPAPSIPGKPDAFEPNYTFERASLIGLGARYTNLNFVPWTGTETDTDFYKLWVVSGKIYTCETFDLGTATNTNIIFCRGASQEHCFAGNDDVQPFEPDTPHRSRLTFFSDYDGWLYLMLGQVGSAQILPEEWKNLSYGLKCAIGLPGTATPTPTSPYVAPQPTPQPSATPTPEADDMPTPEPPAIVVRTMTAPTPPSAPPPPTAAPRLYDIELSLYYDENQNGQADPGEGISDVLARAYDALNGDLLSIDYTDELGALRFTVPADGPVRVSVPFFGFNQVVTTTSAYIQIRIAPLP